MKLPISTININKNRRLINPDRVKELASSMEEIGLLNPVTVDERYNLIAGYHRIEAARLLGWEEMDIRVIQVKGLMAELAEIDENLIREELHYIDRGKQLLRRKEIYEELYPETRAGVAGGKASGIARGTSAETAVVQPPAFADDTATKTGKSARAIHVELQIARELSPEIQELVKQADVTKTDALRLTRLEPEKQKIAVEKLISNKSSDSKPHVAHNSGNNEWYTPSEYIEAARTVMGGIDLDPASNDTANKTVKADNYYTIENDGLTKRWHGKVFMNPPYSGDLITPFCNKIASHYRNGDILEAIVLVNNATETNWFNTLIENAGAVVFPKGRIKYWMPSGETGTPLQGQAFIYFGDNPEGFMKEFKAFGWGVRL